MTLPLRRVGVDILILLVSIPAVIVGCAVGFPAVELWVAFMLNDAALPQARLIEAVLRTVLFWGLVGGAFGAAYWRWWR